MHLSGRVRAPGHQEAGQGAPGHLLHLAALPPGPLLDRGHSHRADLPSGIDNFLKLFAGEGEVVLPNDCYMIFIFLI